MSNPLKEEVLRYIEELGDDELRVLRDYLSENARGPEMSPSARAELTACINKARQEAAQGLGTPGDEFLRRLQARK